jgi:hypothetical protein
MHIEKVKRKSGVRSRSRFMVDSNSFISPWFKTEREALDWGAQKRTEILAGQVNLGADITLFRPT